LGPNLNGTQIDSSGGNGKGCGASLSQDESAHNSSPRSFFTLSRPGGCNDYNDSAFLLPESIVWYAATGVGLCVAIVRKENEETEFQLIDQLVAILNVL
jgi:hypothetical protein